MVDRTLEWQYSNFVGIFAATEPVGSIGLALGPIFSVVKSVGFLHGTVVSIVSVSWLEMGIKTIEWRLAVLLTATLHVTSVLVASAPSNGTTTSLTKSSASLAN